MFVPKVWLFPLFHSFVNFTLTDKHGTKNLQGLVQPCKFPEVLRSHFSQDNIRDKECKRFTIPRCTKEIGRTSIKYRGPLLWNSLPLNIRSIENFHTFKKSLKRAKESVKSVSFLKEASMITFKRTDYIYF